MLPRIDTQGYEDLRQKQKKVVINMKLRIVCFVTLICLLLCGSMLLSSCGLMGGDGMLDTVTDLMGGITLDLPFGIGADSDESTDETNDVDTVLGGIINAEINEDGELVITYQDGTRQNLGVVVGKDGADGQDGKDGEDGKDGKDGVGAGESESNTIIIEGEGSKVSAASSKGLRSAVSIFCTFTATVQQGGWRPGSSSTTEEEYSSAGSGVIYKLDKSKGDAFIITNYHVVYDSSSNTANGISDDISVYLYGSEILGREMKATYVGGSQYYDIAVLYIENSEVLRESEAVAAHIADSDKIVVGENAIAIGNAQGYGIAASMGVVSVDSEYIDMTAADEKTQISIRVIRVDTAVNPGNSGGGLYNGLGELIGIVNAKMIDDSVENIGYAIPSNVAVSIAENIIYYCFGKEGERVQRAMLGITISTTDSKAVYDPDTATISVKETVTVHEVSEGGLAYGAVIAGDVLVSAVLNGRTYEITRQHHVIDMMLDARVGDVVTMNVIRDGVETSVSFTIVEECLTEY